MSALPITDCLRDMAFRYPPSPPLSNAQIEVMYDALILQHPVLPTSQPLLSDFLEDICKLLPAENAAKIRTVFEKQLTTGKGNRDIAPLLDRLCQQLEPIGAGPLIRRYSLRAESEIMSMATAIQKSLDEAGQSLRVMFIATKPYFQVLREAQALQDQGVACGLLCLDHIPAAMRPGFDAAFTSVSDGIRNPTVLTEIISHLAVDVFHVQCWMWSYYLARATIERKRRAKVVCEVYDFTSVYAPRDILAQNWPREVVDTDLAMEQYLCLNADAVIHRYHPDIDDELRERHGGLTRTFHAQPWPAADVTPRNPAKLSDRDGILRMVYAGGILEKEGCPAELFPIRTMPRTFRCFLEQGFHIDLLHDPHRPLATSDGAAEYIALAEEFPGFRLVDGVPPDRLPEALSVYDFGIVVTHIDRDILQVGPGLMRGAVGTKVFAYIEAGIPSVVCKEYEYTAWLVEHHGLGIALETAELETAGPRLHALDRKAIAARILEFNEAHNMSQEITKLVSLYCEITGN